MWPNTPLVRSNHGCSTVDSCEHCNLKRRFPSTIYPVTVESELVTRSRITFLSCRRSISNCEILKKTLIEMRFDGSTLTIKTGRITCLALISIVLTSCNHPSGPQATEVKRPTKQAVLVPAAQFNS